MTISTMQRGAPACSNILDLRGHDGPSSAAAADDGALCNQIIAGLTKQETIIPGKKRSDTQYSHSKTLPTLVLYDDLGLSLYDRITSLEEYYPFQAELRILQTYGPEIAHRLFGLPLDHNAHALDDSSLQQSDFPNGLNKPPHRNGGHSAFGSNTNSSDDCVTKERWGDYSVGGQHNNGVNGNLGLSGSTPQHGCIIELGAGSLKKTAHLLHAVASLLPRNLDLGQTVNGSTHDERTGLLKTAQYFALDVVPEQLLATLQALPLDTSTPTPVTGKIHAQGVCATYNQGLEWIGSRPDQLSAPGSRRCILWLGSSIGNLSRREATTFLKDRVVPAMMEGDTMLIGVDNCQDRHKVELAYNDPHGVTAEFELNAITASGRELGVGHDQGWTKDNFEYASRYNTDLSRHEAYLRARRDIEFSLPPRNPAKHASTQAINGSIKILKGELIGIEHSYKYSHEMMYKTFIDAGLRLVQQWTDPSPDAYHTLYLVEKPRFAWPSTLPVTINGATLESDTKEWLEGPKGLIPTRAEWKRMWSAWDLVTTQMIPENMLFQKPIDLRHICLFYLGHIPTFADIQISRYLKEPFTEPRHFSQIFERGIDPNMEDPSQCHDHSTVPDIDSDWPTLQEVLSFRDRFRERLFNVYADKVESSNGPDRCLARVLTMIYEHEGLHLETLLYMLNQMPAGGVRHPPGFMVPDWQSLSHFWHSSPAIKSMKVSVIEIPATSFAVGQDDPESEDSTKPYDADHSFGWDIENPRRMVHVEAFKVESIPITNRRYLNYLESLGKDKVTPTDIPASWIKTKDSDTWSIRSVYGPVPFDVADLWPCQASAAQLERMAMSLGGRLPKEHELRLWFDRYCPVDSAISNIGFRNWHPIPPTSPTRRVAIPQPQQQPHGDEETGAVSDEWIGGSNGGVWEWTSTPLQAHEGYVKSKIYPGYSSDFFDGHHLVILGGSWATIPRIAGRCSFRNWYQNNYPYVFAGARIVYEA